MNYHRQALVIGFVFILGGVATLAYLIDKAATFTSAAEGNIIAFAALGLLLIGILTSFAAPQPLVASEIVSSVMSPPTADLSIIIDSLLSDSRAIHTPRVTLGGESQVFLIFTKGTRDPATPGESLGKEGSPAWTTTKKVLEPLGINLMKTYEKVLRRDFLELDTQQLSRFLSRATVSELQLASGFSLREIAPGIVEATWTRPTFSHTCLETGKSNHPELCCFCSSVACALSKATGKSVWIEESKMNTESVSVATVYQILG
jgi:hypothetical protein